MINNTEEQCHTYLTYHKKRFQYLLNKIDSLNLPTDAKVLDIGRSPFTKILREKYKNVTTLGLDLDITLLDKADPVSTDIVPHIVFDLNDTKEIKELNIPDEFTLIIFAEVIEHLAIHPEHVLQFFNSILARGGFIIIQTPNAVSITKRIKAVLGIHPFVEYDLDGEVGAHHFREFTKSELLKCARNAGYKVTEHKYLNYFPSPNILLRLIYVVFGIIPGLRNAQTLIIKKQ